MSKVMTIAMIVALLSSVTLAEVTLPAGFSGAFQTQGMIAGIDNNVTLLHGSYGQNTTSLTVNNLQNVLGACGLVANQGQNTFLMGVAEACADCAIIDVSQGIGVVGNQLQMGSAGSGPLVQSENLTLTGVQAINKAEGMGSGNAFQVGRTNQGQTVTNANATATESSAINSVQASSLIGEPGTAGNVGSSVTALTTQNQVVY